MQPVLFSPSLASFVGFFGDNVRAGQLLVPIPEATDTEELTFRQEPLALQNASEFVRGVRAVTPEISADLEVPMWTPSVWAVDDLWEVFGTRESLDYSFKGPSKFTITLVEKWGTARLVAGVEYLGDATRLKMSQGLYLKGKPHEQVSEVNPPTYQIQLSEASLKKFLGLRRQSEPDNMIRKLAWELTCTPLLDPEVSDQDRRRGLYAYKLIPRDYRSGQEPRYNVSGWPEAPIQITYNGEPSAPGLPEQALSIWDHVFEEVLATAS